MKIGLQRRVRLETISLGEGASFKLIETRPSCFKFNWHYHPELELTLIVKGRGVRFVGDSVQDYREGDLCFLGANIPHTWYSAPISREPLHAIVIQFLPHFLGEQFLGVPEAANLKKLFAFARRGLRFGGRTRSSIAGGMHALARDPDGSLRRVCGLLSILNALAESRDGQPLAMSGFDPVLNPQANRRINSVFDLIRLDLRDIPSQRDVARQVRLSPPAFSRFFKRCVGKTYIEYVNELRVGTACRALRETDQSITEIAFQAGFNNLSNFNRRFRDLKKVSPRDYRNKGLQRR